jgi:type IV secretion system protein VirB9
MKRLIFAVGLIVAATSTLALDKPRGTAFDSRVQHVNFNDDDVTQLNGMTGVTTTVVFGAGETVKFLNCGFPGGWEIQFEGNAVFLLPKAILAKGAGPNEADKMYQPSPGQWDTNLTVFTDKHVYTFQVSLLPSPSDGKLAYNPSTSYRVVFHYPSDDAAKAAALLAKQEKAKKVDANPVPVPRNKNYTMQVGKKSSEIAPAEAFDDGRFTYLRFPNNREMPSAYFVSETGEESSALPMINPARPDWIVLPRVARQINLRLGSAVVGVYNESYEPDGVATPTGTTVPGMRRALVGSGETETAQ